MYWYYLFDVFDSIHVLLNKCFADGNEDVVRDLLLCGAISPNNKVFVHSRKLVLPLITAVENNCLPLVQILLEHDASTSVLNQEGLFFCNYFLR